MSEQRPGYTPTDLAITGACYVCGAPATEQINTLAAASVSGLGARDEWRMACRRHGLLLMAPAADDSLAQPSPLRPVPSVASGDTVAAAGHSCPNCGELCSG